VAAAAAGFLKKFIDVIILLVYFMINSFLQSSLSRISGLLAKWTKS
jgi:hypothetical protein